MACQATLRFAAAVLFLISGPIRLSNSSTQKTAKRRPLTLTRIVSVMRAGLPNKRSILIGMNASASFAIYLISIAVPMEDMIALSPVQVAKTVSMLRTF